MAAKRKSGKTQPHSERVRPAVPVRLSREHIAQAEAIAAARGVTRSRFLADTIAAALDATAPPPSRSTTAA
jgi:hypothetical protein